MSTHFFKLSLECLELYSKNALAASLRWGRRLLVRLRRLVLLRRLRWMVLLRWLLSLLVLSLLLRELLRVDGRRSCPLPRGCTTTGSSFHGRHRSGATRSTRGRPLRERAIPSRCLLMTSSRRRASLVSGRLRTERGSAS